MNLNVNMSMKLQIQLKAREKLMAAALGSCRNISDTTMNGIGPGIARKCHVDDESVKQMHYTVCKHNGFSISTTIFITVLNILNS